MSWLRAFARKLGFLRFLSAPPLLALTLVMVGALNIHAAPTRITIVTQPVDQVVSPGQTATFAVVATTHVGTLYYQWFRRPHEGRHAAIPGATSPSYTTPILGLRQNGSKYFVRVSNGRARVESRHARLLVKPTLSIVTQPTDQVVSPGQTATFTVVATTDAGTLDYQWFRRPHTGGHAKIPGATSPSYTTPILSLRQNGSEYFVRVSVGRARIESRHARLAVKPVTPPAKPVVSLDTYVTAGKTGLVASTQNQGPGMTYTWTLTGGTIASGQGTPAITYTAGAAGITLTASVLVTNAGGSASGSATATVVPSPSAELALPLSAHPGDGWMKASVPIQTGMTYLWTVISGTSTASITSGQGTGVIGFRAGSAVGTFQIQANVQNQAGDHATSTRTVTVQTGTWLVKNGGASVPRAHATATLLPSGRVLVVGGQDFPSFGGRILASAEIYDPATGNWNPTGNLGTARESHTATLLLSGKVLVAGGEGSSGLSSAEIYDPSTGTWTPTGSLGTGRGGHTTTLLPNGKVLAAGGLVAGGNNLIYTASVEIYDPATGTWTPTGSLGVARWKHTATLLQNGKVLVAGGYGWSSASLAEIYDPTTGTWTPTGNMGAGRSSHTATLLLDGKALVVGGNADAGAEIYNPETGTWTPTSSMGTTPTPTPSGHTATLLPNGKVLVAGGYWFVDTDCTASSEIYDPTAGTWTPTNSLGEKRSSHTATLLPNGQVLVAGGTRFSYQNKYQGITNSEIYDSAMGTWTPVGSPGRTRSYHTATLFPNGKVLVAGGAGLSTEIYDPATRTWTPTGSLGTARTWHTATLLPNGKVLVAGGSGSSSGTLLSAEIYDPAVGIWTPTGSLGTARTWHTATLLPNGKVLVAGGSGSSGTLLSAELYDPATGIWTPTGGMGTANARHTATLLPNGKVLVAGGLSAEIYDPTTGIWTPTGSLGTERTWHTGTLLLNGKVLVAGGGSIVLSSAEIYDPATGIWTPTGGMGEERSLHTATLLPNGKVLVAGAAAGQGSGGWESYPSASAEIYDPTTGIWTPTCSLAVGRWGHTATLLDDGTVMVAFGVFGDVLSEIYLP